MKLPNPQQNIFSTQFLACLEGNHGGCSHRERLPLATWECQCECHPRNLPAPDNNYELFDALATPLPRSLHHVLRYVGLQANGQPKGLRRCTECGEWRGLCLASQDPLEMHKGLQYCPCACELKAGNSFLVSCSSFLENQQKHLPQRHRGTEEIFG